MSLDEAEGLLAAVQGISDVFRGFSDEEVELLAQSMTILNFWPGQTILEQGESGTWFGIILSGELSVILPNGASFIIKEGAMIGEMALWQKQAVRTATICGHQYTGMIATMLVDDMHALITKHPAIGVRLLRLTGATSLSKQIENMKRLRGALHKEWQS